MSLSNGGTAGSGAGGGQGSSGRVALSKSHDPEIFADLGFQALSAEWEAANDDNLFSGGAANDQGAHTIAVWKTGVPGLSYTMPSGGGSKTFVRQAVYMPIRLREGSKVALDIYFLGVDNTMQMFAGLANSAQATTIWTTLSDAIGFWRNASSDTINCIHRRNSVTAPDSGAGNETLTDSGFSFEANRFMRYSIRIESKADGAGVVQFLINGQLVLRRVVEVGDTPLLPYDETLYLSYGADGGTGDEVVIWKAEIAQTTIRDDLT